MVSVLTMVNKKLTEPNYLVVTGRKIKTKKSPCFQLWNAKTDIVDEGGPSLCAILWCCLQESPGNFDLS